MIAFDPLKPSESISTLKNEVDLPQILLGGRRGGMGHGPEMGRQFALIDFLAESILLTNIPFRGLVGGVAF